jgi:hypothetical protein
MFFCSLAASCKSVKYKVRIVSKTASDIPRWKGAAPLQHAEPVELATTRTSARSPFKNSFSVAWRLHNQNSTKRLVPKEVSMSRDEREPSSILLFLLLVELTHQPESSAFDSSPSHRRLIGVQRFHNKRSSYFKCLSNKTVQN